MESAVLSRREALIQLLRVAGAGAGASGIALWLSRHSARPEVPLVVAAKHDHAVAADSTVPDMAVIQGEDPALLARKAVEVLGGIRRFVARGDVVLVKPNIGWDRTPEQAANTNPSVVAEIVLSPWMRERRVSLSPMSAAMNRDAVSNELASLKALSRPEPK